MTGRATYGADYSYPGLVHGYAVTSTIAHGAIRPPHARASSRESRTLRSNPARSVPGACSSQVLRVSRQSIGVLSPRPRVSMPMTSYAAAGPAPMTFRSSAGIPRPRAPGPPGLVWRMPRRRFGSADLIRETATSMVRPRGLL
ncbi:hypothetical protein B7R87_32005 [Streptomyces tsukubensis]|uniref:Aldehyde oxidase/xanthine dehydrogenase a/b hammerhead domain-containing protein n=1 Tax=Streptomyces tsukubensis (strain DSM 42081 / NBRC 108919 / NRRL 18488 / 9993) TaxID=1114943 RepID=A0A7G3U9M0_STRT9|nr:hypothetical protein B7R87_32005 [Streptomyces tsukubensis]QKM66075.1 hypothetical protein STSU_001775 [Streptomyces tsukubensis NRRL18488]TAI42356.1 hypothetical protein EWI31_22515 [Streptomyces tsukubensis]